MTYKYNSYGNVRNGDAIESIIIFCGGTVGHSDHWFTLQDNVTLIINLHNLH